MAVGDAYVFPGFLTPVLTQLFFPKPPTTFLTCFCRGERRKYAGEKIRLNLGSNSQPPGHKSDVLTTEPPGRGSNLCNSCSKLESSFLLLNTHQGYHAKSVKQNQLTLAKLNLPLITLHVVEIRVIPYAIIQHMNLKEKGLHIASLNIQHLFPKLDEIRIILNMENSDIFGISETFLTENIQNSNLNINGFVFERKDQPHKLGGGLLVYTAEF